MDKQLPYSPPEEGVRLTTSPARTALHLLMGLLCWGLLAYGWWIYAYRGMIAYIVFDVGVAFELTLVGTGITLFWIYQNVGSIRRKGEKRTGLRPVTHDWSRDYLGRLHVGPLEACRKSPVVLVTYSFSRKVFRPVPVTELGFEAMLAGSADSSQVMGPVEPLPGSDSGELEAAPESPPARFDTGSVTTPPPAEGRIGVHSPA